MTEMDKVTEVVQEILKQDKLFTLGAQLIKKTVDALTAEGFTREEAVQIAAVQGTLVKGSR